MKYIIFHFDGHGLPIAYRLKQEGQEVTVGTVSNLEDTLSRLEKDSGKEDPKDKEQRLSLYEGLIDRMPAEELVKKMKYIPNPEEYFVFFDYNNLFKYAEQVKDLGFHGNFPTEEDHNFEIDRDEAKEFVKKHYPKLNIAEKKEFKKIDEAIGFLKNTQDLWVLKGFDSGSNAFVPDVEDPYLAAEQTIEMLNNNKAMYEGSGFLLELMIPSVAEFTPEKIYYDGVPLGVTVMIENKPLGSGNLSITTGCASDLVFPITMQDRINEIAFPPIIDEIAKKHKGLFIWDASLLVNRKGGKVYFGEFCSNRPGYNSLFTEMALLPSVSHFFESIVKMKNPFTLGTVASSVRIFNLHQDKKDRHVQSGLAVSYKPEIEKDVWMWDVRKNKGRLENVGYGWSLGVITGSGRSIDEAVGKLYKNIEKFSFVGGYYRPKADYISFDYSTSILNRLNYGLDRALYQLPFNVKVGSIGK